jgi:hypothetical protein
MAAEQDASGSIGRRARLEDILSAYRWSFVKHARSTSRLPGAAFSTSAGYLLPE